MKISSIPKSGRKGSVVYVNIWIRTCQHIDGWTDVPEVARARVPPLPHSTARPSRAVVAAPTAAGACLRTEAFRGAEIRNPNLETRNKLKFLMAQWSRPDGARWL